jgi:5-methylcytosine-specific restriction endonuclease McrA
VRALIASGVAAARAIYRVRYGGDPAYRAYATMKRNERRKRQQTADDGTLTSRTLQALTMWQSHCPYCGDAMPLRCRSLDHVIPLARGGAHSADNVVICCVTCNKRKHTRTAEEYVAYRRRRGHPVAPQWEGRPNGPVKPDSGVPPTAASL